MTLLFLSECLQLLDVSLQMSWQTVPYLGLSDHKVLCPKTSVRPSGSEAAGHSRLEMLSAGSWPHRYTVSGQIRRRQSMQTLVDHHCQLVHDALTKWKSQWSSCRTGLMWSHLLALSWHELRHSEQLEDSSASRHSHRTADCCSSLDGC